LLRLTSPLGDADLYGAAEGDVFQYQAEPLPRSKETPRRHTPAFARYVGIDYSGASTPTRSLRGLRIYLADRDEPPVEVMPPPGPRKYWTRRGVAEWLLERLAEAPPTIVGIDHGFSFPLEYFDAHGLAHDWSAFLDDFQRHWPTEGDFVTVDCVREGRVGTGASRQGNARWRRRVERQTRAKSVFQFDVKGSVAKSTHAGLPWLRDLRQKRGEHVHFWPFDGWAIQAGRSAVVEVYPRLWSADFSSSGRTPDQHDAYSVAAWLQRADRDGSLPGFLSPPETAEARADAEIEGWILGLR